MGAFYYVIDSTSIKLGMARTPGRQRVQQMFRTAWEVLNPLVLDLGRVLGSGLGRVLVEVLGTSPLPAFGGRGEGAGLGCAAGAGCATDAAVGPRGAPFRLIDAVPAHGLPDAEVVSYSVRAARAGCSPPMAPIRGPGRGARTSRLRGHGLDAAGYSPRSVASGEAQQAGSQQIGAPAHRQRLPRRSLGG